MLRGSCCCGAVQFEISRPPTVMGTCHCSRCRKLGASTFVFVARDAFRLIRGKTDIRRYEPIAPYTYVRTFCGQCGTALGEIGATSDSFPVAANCFDDPLPIGNRFHEFVSEKPAWLEIGDSAKQFPFHPKPPGAPA